MRTPRPATRRGIGTLIGNGWLHEAPKNVWPRGWDIRGRSALRKCMFLPVAPGLKDQLAPNISPAALLIHRPPVHDHVHRRDPAKDARMFAAVTPEQVYANNRAALYANEKAKVLAGARQQPAAWYEDPVALGTLLLIVPPIGLAALWSSKRYSNDARWALTVMTALTLCLAAAITVVVVTLRS